MLQTAMITIAITFMTMFAHGLDATPKTTNHSFMLAKGKEILTLIGFMSPEIGTGQLKNLFEDCVKHSQSPLPVTYLLLNEARQKTFTSNGFTKRASNIFRALKAVDREHSKDYAYGFLELAAESDELDLDLFYRHAYWVYLVDIVLPSHNKTNVEEKMTNSRAVQLVFYEQSNTKPITEKSTSIVDKEEFYRFLSVGKISKSFIEEGVLDNFGHLVNKARKHYHFPPAEEKIFESLTKSLKAYSDRNKQKQHGKLSSSDNAERRAALTAILDEDPNKVLVRHEATLTRFATESFIQGKKPLRMRSLSRLYSLVEKFSHDEELYHELRWHYMRVYKQSVSLSKKIKLADDFADAHAPDSGISSHQEQFVDNADLYFSEVAGLLTETQIRELRSKPVSNAGGKTNKRTRQVRDHPSFDQIKRHSYFEHIIDAVIDKHLQEAGSSYSAAREYIIKNGISVLGINAKERNAYVYEGEISPSFVDRLKEKLKDIKLNHKIWGSEKQEALERITQVSPEASNQEKLITTTIKLIEEAIKITNRVYNEGENKLTLFRVIKVWSELKQAVMINKVNAETVARAEEVVNDLQQKIANDDVDAQILAQLLEYLALIKER